VTDEAIAGDEQVDLLFTDEEELSEELIMNTSFGCSDHETEEFKIHQGGKRAISKLQTLGSEGRI